MTRRVDVCVAEIAEISAATHHDGPLPETRATEARPSSSHARSGGRRRQRNAALWLADNAWAAHTAPRSETDEEKSEAILGSEDLTASGLRGDGGARRALLRPERPPRRTDPLSAHGTVGLARFVVENSRAVLCWLPRAGPPLAALAERSIFGYNAAQPLEEDLLPDARHADDLEQALRQLSEVEQSGAPRRRWSTAC